MIQKGLVVESLKHPSQKNGMALCQAAGLSVVLLLLDPICAFLLPCQYDLYPCGQPVVQPIGNRIVGGQEALRGSWPWMVQVHQGNKFVCGGSIIGNRFVLTAAHCFWDRKNDTKTWAIYAGKQRTDRTEKSQQSPKIAKIIMHQNFNVVTFENDVALIYLAEPLVFNTYIKPICLPAINRGVTTGEMCLIAGWGETRGTGIETHLNQVEVPIISDKVCSSPDWYGPDFHGEKTLCAGYEQGGKDACQGDSGGPLICKDGTSWVVQGISSWGIECGVFRWPGIYTQVSNFTEWMEENIAQQLHDICD